MAIQSNRALIACSVLALASAIVTLYYWQLRKRRKQSPQPAPVCGERIVVEEEEGDSQILNSLPLATTAAVSAVTTATTNTAAVVEQIKVLDNCTFKSHGEEDTVDGATCVEKSNCITVASTVVANYSCPSEADTEATTGTRALEMANEVEVHDSDCRTDSMCSDRSALVDSTLEGECSTETGAPELTKELTDSDGSDSKPTETAATAADSGSDAVVVENRTPATSAAVVANADAASAATTASDVVATPTEAPLQVDNQPKPPKEQQQQKEQAAKSGQTQAQISSPPASKSAEPASDTAAASSAATAVVSAGASTSTSTASVADTNTTSASSDSTTTIRVAPAVTSRKIITSNPVTSSQTFAQVLSKKSSAAVPTTKQSKKMAQSGGPKPVDQPKTAAKKAVNAPNAKAAISYASVVQESSSNSSPTSPSTAITTNTNTTISSSSKQQEEVDAYRNYPDATSATPSQSSSSVEGQCSPNSDLGEFTCDVRSLGSNDSGTGSSELLHADTTITNGGDHSQQSSPASAYHIVNDGNSPTANNPSEDQSCVMCYQFELPYFLCGKLIGSNGHFINYVKQNSGTQIIVGSHYISTHKICSITGTKTGINTALTMIRKRFPYKEYPDITLAPFANPNIQILPQSCQLQLAPDHVVNDVILACTISAGHFFLQQPTHPTYPQLNQLDHLMKIHYSEGSAPQLPDVYPGLLCAAPTEEGWYRAMIKYVNQSKTQCDIMFVDYGGYAFNVPVATLRPIRSDFIVLPFQASECFLANVMPVDAKNDWSSEANQFFVEQAKGQIIHAAIDGYDENGIPYVTLFKLSQVGNRTDINAALVEKGYARWAESDESKLNGKN